MLFFILLKFILILGSSFSAVERCDENEVRLVHCETISIPLPNPFQRCPSDQVWPAQNKSKLCFSSQNIARGLVFIDTSNDRKEIKSLTDGEEGTGEQVGKNTISIWELDLKQLVHVYAIVIQTDQAGLGLHLVVQTVFQLSSNKSDAFVGDCWNAVDSERYVFYCYDRQEWAERETVSGRLTQHVRISVTKLNSPNPVAVSEIQVYENQGIECGKPVGVYSPVRDSYPVGSRVIYQCDEDSNGSTTSERVCHSDGTWSPAAGCMRTDTGCPQPDTPLNGNLSWIRSAWDFPKIRFTCHEGYRLSKDAEAECKNGKWLWKGGPPKCQRIFCPFPEDVNDTYWKLNSPSTVEGSLVTYYYPLSNYTMICDRNGSWSLFNPVDQTDNNAISSNKDHDSLAFMRRNYWVVVVPFVVLCVVVSLCVIYKEQIHSWCKRQLECVMSNSVNSDTSNQSEDISQLDDGIWAGQQMMMLQDHEGYDGALSHVYERICLLVPPPEEDDEQLHLHEACQHLRDCDRHVYAQIERKRPSEDRPIPTTQHYENPSIIC